MCVTKSGYTSPRNSPTDVNSLNNNQKIVFEWLRSSVSSISTAHQSMVQLQKDRRSITRAKRKVAGTVRGKRPLSQSTFQTYSTTVYPSDTHS